MEDNLKKVQACCWRYLESVHNYPGLHFTATPKSCDTLLTFLRWFQQQPTGTYRTIPLAQLTREDGAGISGDLSYKCFSKLRVTISPESPRLRQMSFRVDDRSVHFDFTARGVGQFEQGLRDVKNGNGDYCISSANSTRDSKSGNDDEFEQLWFWPHYVIGHGEMTRKASNRR